MLLEEYLALGGDGGVDDRLKPGQRLGIAEYRRAQPGPIDTGRAGGAGVADPGPEAL